MSSTRNEANGMLTLEPLDLDALELRVEPPDAVVMRGKLTLRHPREELQPHLKKIHAAAVADGIARLHVDLTQLTFVNSSAIRLLIDWAMWIKNGAEAERYILTFITRPQITWQRTSLSAIRSLAPGVVEMTTDTSRPS